MATAIVREALEGSGIDLVASCDASRYDDAAPDGLRAGQLLEGARGVVVAASSGPALFRAFLVHQGASPARWSVANPYDEFVELLLARADEALARAGVAFRRFDATFAAPVRLDFLALARLSGLGSPGPFGLYIHAVHGPWWALRGAWVVSSGDVEAPPSHAAPCVGCDAPCVGGVGRALGLEQATAEVRQRCVVGQESRYDADQIAYHYDRARTIARLRG